jgi:hypothetical protein
MALADNLKPKNTQVPRPCQSRDSAGDCQRLLPGDSRMPLVSRQAAKGETSSLSLARAAPDDRIRPLSNPSPTKRGLSSCRFDVD